MQDEVSKMSLQSVMTFLVADYLERNANLPMAAQAVRDEVESKGLLGTVLDWTGQQRNTRVGDIGGRFSEIASNQLERLLRHSLLTDQGTENAPPIKLLYPTQLSNEGEFAEIVTLESDTRKLEKELKKLNDGGASMLVDECGGLSYLERRKRELNAALIENISKMKHLKSGNLRDFLIQRHRSRKNIFDLVTLRSEQGPSTSNTRILNKSRDLAYSRLSVTKKIYGHKAFVFCVNVDPSGRWIVTGSDDSLLKLWNARTGELCRTFRAHELMITDIAIDKSGKYLLSCSVDSTTRLWDLETGRNVAVLNTHSKSVNSVDFEPDELLTITAADDGACCIWDTKRIIEEDENEIQSMMNNASVREDIQTNMEPVVNALAIAEAGLTNAFLPAKVPIVLPHIGENDNRLLEVNCVSVRCRGGIIVTGADDGACRVWFVSKALPQKCLVVERKRILYKYPSAKTKPGIVKGDYVDGANRLATTIKITSDGITSVMWSNKGDRILVGSIESNTVAICSWHSVDADAGGSPDFFSRCDTRIISVGNSCKSSATANTTKEPVEMKKGNMFRVPTLDACCWTTDDRFIIVSQSVKRRKDWDVTEYDDLVEFFDQKVKIYNSYTGELVHSINAHRKPAYVLRPDPFNENIFMTGGHDGQICVFDACAGKLLKKIEIPSQYGALTVLDASFSPPGSSSSSIVASDAGGRLIFIGTDAGTQYTGAYAEQFLSNDYADLMRDDNGIVMDARSQMPPHLITGMQLVDSQGVVYETEPSAQQKLTWTIEEQMANSTSRRKLVRNIELHLESNERAEMDKQREKNEKIDALIAKANETNSNAIVPTNKAKASAKRKPADYGKRYRESELYGSDIEDDDEPVEVQPQNSRGRRAKSRAQGRIRKFNNRHNQSGSDDNDADDDQWEGAIQMEEEEDEEEEEEELDSSDETGSSDDDGTPQRTRKSGRQSKQRRFLMDSEEEDYQVSEKPTRNSRRIVIDTDEDEVEIVEDTTAKKRKVVSTMESWDRTWLRKTARNSHVSQYVPQEGDKVIYFPQGHQEYLKVLPMGSIPSWMSEKKNAGFIPMVLCYVSSVSFQFPEQKYHGGHILLKCNLSVEGIPAPLHSARLVPVDAEDLWIAPGQEHKDFEISLSSHTMSDFLVLQSRYEVAINHNWKVRDAIRVKYQADTGDPLDYRATITQVNPKNPEYPGSRWECLVVRWDLGNEERISPWEATRSDHEPDSFTNDPTLVQSCANEIAEDLEQIVRVERIAQPFIEPVDASLHEMYSQLIPLPMELRTMIARLRSGFYRHKRALLADIELLQSNCLAYNDPESVISKDVQALCLLLKECVPESTDGDEAGLNSKSRRDSKRRKKTLQVDDAPTLSKVRPSTGIATAALVEALSLGVDRLRKYDRHKIFAFPVDEQLIPGYRDVISHPMDLSTIENRFSDYIPGDRDNLTLTQSQLALKEFEKDAVLICSNAIAYNTDGSNVNNAAKGLEKVVDSVCAEIAKKVLGISKWTSVSFSNTDKKRQSGLYHAVSSHSSNSTKRSSKKKSEESLDEESEQDETVIRRSSRSNTAGKKAKSPTSRMSNVGSTMSAFVEKSGSEETGLDLKSKRNKTRNSSHVERNDTPKNKQSRRSSRNSTRVESSDEEQGISKKRARRNKRRLNIAEKPEPNSKKRSRKDRRSKRSETESSVEEEETVESDDSESDFENELETNSKKRSRKGRRSKRSNTESSVEIEAIIKSDDSESDSDFEELETNSKQRTSNRRRSKKRHVTESPVIPQPKRNSKKGSSRRRSRYESESPEVKAVVSQSKRNSKRRSSRNSKRYESESSSGLEVPIKKPSKRRKTGDYSSDEALLEYLDEKESYGRNKKRSNRRS